MQRKMEASAFHKVRDGLECCRAAKDQSLEQLEDCREFPEDPWQQEAVINALNGTQKNVQEHLDAIKDVMNIMQQQQHDKDG